jgi:hypothetical protein
VAEEASTSLTLSIPNTKPREKLVEVDTPRPSGEDNKENIAAPRLAALANGDEPAPETTTTLSPKASGKQPAVSEEPMKTIEI